MCSRSNNLELQKQTYLFACRCLYILWPILVRQSSAELWEFNPVTRVWTEVIVDGTLPSARDGHTASVSGSKMLIFGGRGSETPSTSASVDLFGDEWEIDLDPSSGKIVQTSAPAVSWA